MLYTVSTNTKNKSCTKATLLARPVPGGHSPEQ